MTLSEDQKRVRAQLDALKKFENTRTVRQLRKELQERLKNVEGRLARAAVRRRSALRQKQEVELRRQKSNKLRRYHNYIRLIHDNYPEHSYSEIRSMLKARKEGQDVSIPDVVWQNPSP